MRCLTTLMASVIWSWMATTVATHRERLEADRRRTNADSVADLVVNGHDDAVRRAFLQTKRMRLDEVAVVLRTALRPRFAHGAERPHETAAFGEDRQEKVDAGHRALIGRHELQLFRRDLREDRHEYGAGGITRLHSAGREIHRDR